MPLKSGTLPKKRERTHLSLCKIMIILRPITRQEKLQDKRERRGPDLLGGMPDSGLKNPRIRTYRQSRRKE